MSEKMKESAPENDAADMQVDVDPCAAECAASDAAQEDPAAVLQNRVDELEKENADLKDQYLRKAADFENFRKRSIREKQDAIDYANTNLLLDIITIIDDFERAIKVGETAADVASFRDGVVMIKDKFTALLSSKYNLTGYDSVGTAFDPNVHEALGRLPADDVTEPTVGEEYLRGYMLKDRVVRAAKVMVKMPQAENAETNGSESPAAETPES